LIGVLVNKIQEGDEIVSQQMVDVVFPVVSRIIVTTDDTSIMQAGSRALSAFIRVASSSLSLWRDEHGRSGVQRVIEAIQKLLHPNLGDSAAFGLGSLITKFIHYCAKDLDAGLIYHILQSTLQRLAQAQLPSLTQELLLVFARLMNSNLDQTIDLLYRTQVNQQNGLQFFISKWVSSHENFSGAYSLKLSLIALIKLFQSSDPRLVNLKVAPQKSAPATKKKSETPVSVHVRLLQIIVREYQVILEEELLGANPVNQKDGRNEDDLDEDAENDVDEDDLNEDEFEDQALELGLADDDDETQVVEGSQKTKSTSKRATDGGTLANLFGLMELAESDDDEDEQDPDIQNDPICHLNIKEYLEQFFRVFYQQDRTHFLALASSGLNQFEQETLKKLLD